MGWRLPRRFRLQPREYHLCGQGPVPVSEQAALFGDPVERLGSKRLTHPNEKPVELLKYLIEAVSGPGDVILDPFVGSGTTAAAAKTLGRRYIGIELDRGYANAARARISKVEQP